MNWVKNPGKHPGVTGPVLVMFNGGEVVFDEVGAPGATWAIGSEDWRISHYLLLPRTPRPVSWLTKVMDGKVYARFTGRGKELGRIAVLAHLYSDVYLLYGAGGPAQTITLKDAGEYLQEGYWCLDAISRVDAGEAP